MKLPRSVLKIKRLSKTKTVIIFRKNYLKFEDFSKQGSSWILEDKFDHHGTNVDLKLIINSVNFDDAFSVNSKQIKVYGSRRLFGIFIRLPYRKLPFDMSGKFGCIEYNIKCEGKELAYDNGSGLKQKKQNNEATIYRDASEKTCVDIPSSVVWSASHPFQGGGVSPR